MVFDGHSDLLYDVARRRLAGERRVLETRHLDTLRRGGVEGLVLALWANAPAETFWRGTAWADPADFRGRTEQLLRCGRADLAESGHFRTVRTVREAEAARSAGQIYAFLAAEGMAARERTRRAWAGTMSRASGWECSPGTRPTLWLPAPGETRRRG